MTVPLESLNSVDGHSRFRASMGWFRLVCSNGMGWGENMTRWMDCGVSHDAISDWVEADVLRAWGFKAATRAFHIAQCGRDAEVVGPYKNCSPTMAPVRLTDYEA